MSRIIDGKASALVVRRGVAKGVERFRQRYGRAPALHFVLASEEAGSVGYVRSKEKAAAEAGMTAQVHRFPPGVSPSALHGLIAELNRDEGVDGILVQLPLPGHISADALLESVDPAKDVDGLHPMNVGRLWSGNATLAPCTPRGCLHLLREAGIVLEGARALVIGRSNLVGKPTAALLVAANASVTLAHSYSQDLPRLCREADVLVVAVGRPRLVQGDWIKPGAAVIDVGANRGADGKPCGDVDFEAAARNAALITPVPGGVGPMTIAMLLDNTLRAAETRRAQASVAVSP
jgi:methylenetetrahydrofolate dehydrogenase (NADP+)/methenyltetrahydrofolate cyclohydrolase